MQELAVGARRRGAKCVREKDLQRHLSRLLVQSRQEPEHAAVVLRYEARRAAGEVVTDREVAACARPEDVCAKVGDDTWLLVADVAGAAEAMHLADSVRAQLGGSGFLGVHLAHPWREASEVLSDVLKGTGAFPPRPRSPAETP